MKKIIKKVTNGIVQVTVADERFYGKDVEVKMGSDVSNASVIKIITEWVPSVTWIASYWYKEPYLIEWIAKQGIDEAEAIRRAAGNKGSKVHAAIVDLLDGSKVKMDAQYVNPDSGQLEELKLEEYNCLLSFVDWFLEIKPKVLGREFVVWGDGYAGTVDLLCEINGEKFIVDFKTSKSISDEHKIQVSAYKHALDTDPSIQSPKLAILQVGYGLNKKGFKFTEIDDCYQDFLTAKYIWEKKNKDVQPKIKDYPEILTLNL